MNKSLLQILCTIVIAFNIYLIFTLHVKSQKIGIIKKKLESMDVRLINDSILFHVNLNIKYQKIPLLIDTIFHDHQFKLIYRYSDNMCQSCVQSGIDVFENVFGNESSESLLTVYDNVKFLKNTYHSLQFENEFLPLDRAQIPYFILVNKNEQILFFIPVFLNDTRLTLTILKDIKETYFKN